MSEEVIFTGQSIAKSCIVGDRNMNRYAIFNGLELPRRIDNNLTVTLLGVATASPPTLVAAGGGGGSMTASKWYAYRIAYASSKYTRPVPVADGSGATTRGNPSTALAAQLGAGDTSMNVTVGVSTQAGMTHTLIYRSNAANDQANALAGPFFYVGQVSAAGIFHDTVGDLSLGMAVETDNFPPNAYRYAVQAHGYIFAGGNLPLGPGLTCTVTPGSSTVTISGEYCFDGIRGWNFKCFADSTGGVDSAGLFFANYVNPTTIQLVDASGVPMNYDGTLTGAGQLFTLYLPGFVLRWSKYEEPEAWPALNIINFEGDITGIARMPNQPILIVCTNEPTIYALDLTQIGTYVFKTGKHLLSTQYTASSHFSLVDVEGRLRAIDAHTGCIIQIDGASVRDITSTAIPKIFDWLSRDMNQVKNWHCAYDSRQHMFGAFVTLRNSHRVIDFCVGQHTTTGSWFYNLEKDLLSTGRYQDDETGEVMVLGGTEGYDEDGGRWGRIWCPNIYIDWANDEKLIQGTITDVLDTLEFEVDNSVKDLDLGGHGLRGLWVLVCDENGEYAQVGYIESNTANTITCSSVICGGTSSAFYPSIQVGWKFYIGLIEIRWGPKRFDFDDPDSDKKISDVWMTVSDYDVDNLPFIRIFRGLDQTYWKQLALVEDEYMGGGANQTLHNRLDSKFGPTPRWGVALLDRSYVGVKFQSLSVAFSRMTQHGEAG